jgi:hypothetical protein
VVTGVASPTAAQFSPWATFPLQYADARVLPAGVLRLGFLPSYANYNQRFAPDGTVEALGADLTADTLGSNILDLGVPESLVRGITGDSTYRMSLGPVTTRLDADVRRFPFDFALGLTRWLTVTARVSLVKTRMQAFVALDSTQGSVGWNQATSPADNQIGAAQIAALLSQLGGAIQSLSARITAGDFGCPGSVACMQAMTTRDRATALHGALASLTATQVPVAPLSSSLAGAALRAQVAAIADTLQGLGLGSFQWTLALPTTSLTAADFQTLLAAEGFGYGLLPIATTDIEKLGDTELGLRLGLLQRPATRILLSGAVRLPTASRDSTRHPVDLGTGDAQLDISAGIEAAMESGSLGLSAAASYTRQFADQPVLRWTAPDRPLALAASERLVRRDLGDVFQASVYPSLELSDAFRVFLSAYYYRKGRDGYSDPTGALDPAVSGLGAETQQRGLFLGAGIHYRAERTSGGAVRLPVEAGLSYQAAFRGSGGMTPKSTVLNLYLRLSYRVFGER